MSSTTTTVFDIPIELIQRTLIFCCPSDVAAFSQACRFTYNIVYCAGDQHLWRQLYLRYPLDNPYKVAEDRKAVHIPCSVGNLTPLDWKDHLTSVVKAEKAACNEPSLVSEEDRHCALQIFEDLITSLPISQRTNGSLVTCRIARWIEETLTASPLLRLSNWETDSLSGHEDWSERTQQMQARLRV